MRTGAWPSLRQQSKQGQTDHHRVGPQRCGGVYYFVYDPTASIPAVVYEQGPTNRYLNIREPDGSLVSRETYDDDGARTMSRTYHFDGLGSTMALTDDHGEVTDRYAYDEWGNLTGHTGSGTLTTDNPYQYVGRYGYYTHYQEPDFGLLQLGVRYYDPTLGRFTQHGSPYTYADNNPLGAAAPPKPPPDLSKPPVRGIPKESPVRPGEGAGKATCGLLSRIGGGICAVARGIGYVGRVALGAGAATISLTLCAASPAGDTCDTLQGCAQEHITTAWGIARNQLVKTKGTSHPKPCRNVLEHLQKALAYHCIDPGDADPDSAFCKAVCAFHDWCKGRTWPKPGHRTDPITPLDDKVLDPFYAPCKCK